MTIMINTTSPKEMHSESGYNYFGARYYDSELSYWLSVDPLADERSWVSPYSYVQNSPVMRVDPSGALDDEWELNKKTGEVKWVKESEKHQLFTVDENGNRTGESVTVKYRDVLDQFSTKGDLDRKDSGGNSVSKGHSTGSIDDVFKVFKFAADNSDAEWALSRYNNDKYAVWTSHNSDYVSRIGLNNEIAHMHSHPDINFDKELSSMGVAWTENHGGYYYPLAKSPLGGKTPDWQRIINGHGASHEYVYFPNSGNLHYIHNTNRNKPSKIRNIKNHNGFYFGTLNHR